MIIFRKNRQSFCVYFSLVDIVYQVSVDELFMSLYFSFEQEFSSSAANQKLISFLNKQR